MAIVETYQVGNAIVEIDDTYCKDQTKEDKDKILRNLGDIYRKAWEAGAVRDSTEEELAKLREPSKAVRIR